jgi:hypothetical protein
MAVVQISRIQVRRGRSNSGTGIPQLASGEFGWAVDDQALYIGNGSVSEGAPAVGNTRILTENTNIFDLVEQYQYKRSDASYITGESVPVQRTLQQRLDDQVSVRSFGALGDGTTDDRDAIQRAIDAIYIDYTAESIVDPQPKRRVELIVEAGNYLVSGPIYIYPFITLKGAGKDKTVIRADGEFSAAIAICDPYKTDPLNDATLIKYETDVNQYSAANESGKTQPRYINITGITFQTLAENEPVFVANAMRNSQFVDVKFKSTFEIGDPLVDNVDFNIGLAMVAKSVDVTCQNNIFDNCEFENCAYGIDSTYDIQHNTFRSCIFTNLGIGAYLGWDVVVGVTDPEIGSGRQVGPRWTRFEKCKFIDIDRQCIYIGRGVGNVSSYNSYIKVGNDGGGSASTIKYPVIEFEFDTNVSENDYFERAYDLSPASSIAFRDTAYVSEIAGSAIANQKYFPPKSITGTSESILLKLPGNQDAVYRINYYYVCPLLEFMRRGTVTLLADLSNDRVHITDDFDVTGNLSEGENLTFTADFADSDANGIKDSILLNYTSNQNGTLKYWYDIQS